MTVPRGNISQKSGLAPGSLIHVGNKFESNTLITLVDYNKNEINRKQISNIDDINQYKTSESVTWLIVEGLSNIDLIEKIGRQFNIHQLVLEDILNTHQRPKFEVHEEYLFIVVKYLQLENIRFSISYEQISVLVTNKFVVVFKEKQDEIFNSILKRLQAGNKQIRSLGADYLSYSILDTIVDQYFIVLDALDDPIFTLEDNVLTSDSNREVLKQIQTLKRELMHIRRVVAPVRDLLSEMLRSDTHLIHEKTHIFLRDVADHTIRASELIETYRDILLGLLDIYISVVNNKMNEVMKVLTIFASIFIPMTFITGIYGMNFDYMPELKWKWSYPLLWVLFLAIPLSLALYFKRKKWF